MVNESYILGFISIKMFKTSSSSLSINKLRFIDKKQKQKSLPHHPDRYQANY